VLLPHAPYCRGRVGQPEGNRRNGTKVTLAGRVDFCAAALTRGRSDHHGTEKDGCPRANQVNSHFKRVGKVGSNAQDHNLGGLNQSRGDLALFQSHFANRIGGDH